MIYLLDTHTLIWCIIDPDKLSKLALEIIENQENTILVSAISFWEISLKYSLGKINLHGVSPDEFSKLSIDMGFESINLSTAEAANYHQLNANWHKDPFDKMLIWQAVKRNISLISKDENVAKYSSIGLKVVW
ncbi:type II toxin-antitoxin system VapC family toxin [Pedobacter frigiditerrae]|uniref:type II toxin-antitoxin system VapC family toxin n=1 Tax=Pedobacter frigiditerrae TaxID=2530452 RepID=UPI00292F3BDB|nr:type II toxin-antitoxin system VapC family toxin [Pedobacter frigiditerrae]